MTIGSALAALLALGAMPAAAPAANCAQTSVGLKPLPDLSKGTHGGFEGGLYPGGANARPAAHDTDGQLSADAIVPRDGAGNPGPGGRYALLSIGMSNTTQEFQRFLLLANPDPARDPRLALVDGAQGGMTGAAWANPAHAAWAMADARLAAAGVTPQQVAAAWVKLADSGPSAGFPAAAQTLQAEFEAVARNLFARYPNIRVAYLSSRIYAGYASTMLNPEPYAYEGGFSAKWAIADQLAGTAGLNFDPGDGPVLAPWLAWGPYLWADGLNPRAGDGLTWACSELAADGTHPSTPGADKVARLLLDFLKADSTARLWFSPPAPSSRKLSLKLRVPAATSARRAGARGPGGGSAGLVASGKVRTAGFVGCRIKARVQIQRRAGGSWRRIAGARTKRSGSYRARVADEPGLYRASVSKSTVGAERNQPCRGARSQVRRVG